MVVLSSMWESIQSSLFPFFKEEIEELTAKQQKHVSTLEIILCDTGIEPVISCM